MTVHQAFVVLEWFRYKSNEVGHDDDDKSSICALIDIIKECDDVIPDREFTYREFCQHYMDFYYKSL